MNTDGILWRPSATVAKYDDDQVKYARRVSGLMEPDGDTLRALCTPYDVVKCEGNLLTTAGLNRLTALLIGASTGTMDATRVRLGVGDSSTAAAVGDTSLGANQYFMTMDATYPTQSNGVVTLQATYGSSVANFVWNCWGCDVGTATVAAGTAVNTPLMNRKVAALGTKSSGSWVLNVTITIS